MIRSRKNTYGASLIGALLIFPFCFLVSSSCMQDPTKDDSPGVSASSQAVLNAIVDAWGLQYDDPFEEIVSDLKLQEAVTYENAYVISGSTQDIVMKKNRRTSRFIRFSKDTTGMILTLNFGINIDPIPNSAIASKPYAFESSVVIDFTPKPEPGVVQGAEVTAAMANAFKSFQKRIQDPPEDASDGAPPVTSTEYDPDKEEAELISIHDLLFYAQWCTYPGVSCYNLKRSAEFLPAPEIFVNKPNCGGLPKCQLKVNRVEYMVSSKYMKDGVQKESRAVIKLKFAPQMPYLARTLQKCIFQMYVINNQAVAADYCQTVVGAAFGTDSSQTSLLQNDSASVAQSSAIR
ncbi:MAG: hypothetical protein V4736_02390 [Bdellovibrionota bacterium]